MSQIKTRRVVVSGLGAITSLSHNFDTLWHKILLGECGISLLPSELSHQIGGAVKVAARIDHEALHAQHFPSLPKQNIAKFASFALMASEQALKSADLVDENSVIIAKDRTRMGVAIASGMGSMGDIVESCNAFHAHSHKKVSPYFVPKILINMAAGQVSIKYGLQGPLHAVATACAASCHAIGDAFNFIRLGYADVMLAGGTESTIDALSLTGFARMKALSTEQDPVCASRPFDIYRNGFVMGEGACVFVLEELQHALNRGAPIIAEVAGYGLSADASHATAPEPSGDGARRSMECALRDANIDPSEIGYINAHATSTPLGDAIETKAIENVFSATNHPNATWTPRSGPLFVSSTKGATGHLLGAAGALESMFCVLALRDNVCPPTINLMNPDPNTLSPTESFYHVPNVARAYSGTRPLMYALNNSFGFGGTNSSLVFKKFTTSVISQ